MFLYNYFLLYINKSRIFIVPNNNINNANEKIQFAFQSIKIVAIFFNHWKMNDKSSEFSSIA